MAEYHGKPYDPDALLCQDDYEWLTETGPYAHGRVARIRRGLNRLSLMIANAQQYTSKSLAYTRLVAPESLAVPALEAVMEALDERDSNVSARLALLDASPHMGYYQLRKKIKTQPTMQYDAQWDCFSVPFPDGRLLCTTSENFLEASGMMPLAYLDNPFNWLPCVDGKTVWIVEVQPCH